MEFNKEKLKEDFIEAFGQELCDEEEILEIYQGVIETVCNDYLSIQPVPVVFDNLIDEVSRYDINLKAIILNRKYKNDYEELLNSTLHELEHHWQLLYVSGFDTPKAKRWKHELENYNPYNPYQEIEIDAYAFAQIIGKCEFGIDYKCKDFNMQMLVDAYINSKKILSDD